MSPRLRVWLLVMLAAAAAAGVTVGATALTSSGTHTAARTPPRPSSAAPPLVLDLGVRTDPEAQALRRALVLYAQGKRRKARAIFARYRSPEAVVGAELSNWPAGFAALDRFARGHPRSAVAQLNVGLARLSRGDSAGAKTAWREAKSLAPDSLYAIRAGDLLHPNLPIPGLPQFVPSFPSPPQLAHLAPPAQFAFLRAAASKGGARAKLLYGVALQRLDRPVSAEREFAAALALAPADAEVQVAAAVGLFDKDRPARAFARIGPLAVTYPHAVTVRFHLGLLLLWLGQVTQARKELQIAVTDGPRTPLGKEAQAFLVRLRKVRTTQVGR